MKEIILEDNEYELLLGFLEEYSDRLSNDGCNDYLLENNTENIKLMQRAIKYNFKNNDEANNELKNLDMDSHNTEIYAINWMLVNYLIHVLKDRSTY